jgi:tetratricopeptide (TPR) repeat protein
MNPEHRFLHQHRKLFKWLTRLSMAVSSWFILSIVFLLQNRLDLVFNRTTSQIHDLASLPNGEYLKPALLGFHHLGADILWLRLLQVVGEKHNSPNEYEWMYYALDTITTLDPQYGYAFYVGGGILGDLAQRTDLSNRLLLKGSEANPKVWNIPFLLGYNYYFLLGDPEKGAEYIMRAASLPDRPAYLPGLATRLSAEAGNPETALAFLETRLRDAHDPEMREFFVNRMKEVMIERDIQILERAVEVYRTKHQALPPTLTALVTDRVLPGLSQEPFDGVYRLDAKTGAVSSSTHPDRLRTFFKRTQPPVYLPKITPAYSFPRTWE